MKLAVDFPPMRDDNLNTVIGSSRTLGNARVRPPPDVARPVLQSIPNGTARADRGVGHGHMANVTDGDAGRSSGLRARDPFTPLFRNAAPARGVPPRVTTGAARTVRRCPPASSGLAPSPAGGTGADGVTRRPAALPRPAPVPTGRDPARCPHAQAAPVGSDQCGLAGTSPTPPPIATAQERDAGLTGPADPATVSVSAATLFCFGGLDFGLRPANATVV